MCSQVQSLSLMEPTMKTFGRNTILSAILAVGFLSAGAFAGNHEAVVLNSTVTIISKTISANS